MAAVAEGVMEAPGALGLLGLQASGKGIQCAGVCKGLAAQAVFFSFEGRSQFLEGVGLGFRA